jgi:RNA polymerase sigma factor (sigma-70 family)
MHGNPPARGGWEKGRNDTHLVHVFLTQSSLPYGCRLVMLARTLPRSFAVKGSLTRRPTCGGGVPLEGTMTDEVIALRPRMMSVAYRMLGSVADAEDAVQDAFMRFHTAGGVSSPEGFLIRTTTRLCIDRLRERKRREYVGPWVPEPLETRSAAKGAALTESLTQAFLLLLERLTPDERAAFLLRFELAWSRYLTGRSEVCDGRLQRDGVPQPGGGRMGANVRVKDGRVRVGKVRPIRADQQAGVRVIGGC